jgi:Ca-activated chloride channel family protein
VKPTVLLDYEFAVSANAYTVRALLKLEGKAPEHAARTPLNLSLVLDRSGSMAGDKLLHARRAAALLVRRLDPQDLVSVVVFDDEVETVAPPATGAAQADLGQRIEMIEPGGSTNLSGGWLRGRDFVAAGKLDGGVNRVLLLTDGQANVGITDHRSLVGLCRAGKERGITTTTLGFGEDYDEHLLREMADAGGGSTYYIETPDQAAGVFAEEIEGLLSLSAQNVSVEIRPGSSVQLTAVHHSYPHSKMPDGMRLELGDLYAREPRTLLVEFLVPDPGMALDVQIAEITVSAHVLTADGGVERQEVRFPVSHPLSREGHTEPEVRRELLLQGAARARDAALEAQSQGDFRRARRHLREAKGAFAAAPMPADSAMQEEMTDLEAMEHRMELDSFTPADAKYLHQRAYDTRRGTHSKSQWVSRVRRPQAE